MIIRKITITTICISFFTLITNAQLRFQKTIGGPILDWANSIEQTPDSGYIILGSTKNFGAGLEDLYLIKTNLFGDTTWTRTFGDNPNDEEGVTVHRTDDGGYILAANTLSFGAGNSDFYLIKTDNLGNLLWSKTYGGTGVDVCEGLEQCFDGGFVLFGSTNSFGAGVNDGWLVRTNAMGDTLWTRTLGTASADQVFATHQTSDSGFVVSGTTVNGSMLKDLSLIKLDPAGNISWSKLYGGTGDEMGHAVVQTSDGGYLIGGEASSFGAGGADIYFLKTDANGDTLWARVMGGLYNDAPFSMVQNSDGGYTLAGFTDSFSTGFQDLLLIKADSLGQAVWVRTVGGLSNAQDVGKGVQQTIDGGFIVTGFTQSFGTGGGTDIFLVKTDSTGESGCNHVTVSFTEQVPVTTITNVTGIVENTPLVTVTNPATIQRPGGGIVNVACTTVGLTETANLSQALIYPNPFSTSAVIEINSDGISGEAVFILCDMQGREVKKLVLANSAKGKLSGVLYKNHISPGMYFYTVKVATDLSHAATVFSSGKLVVQ